jgi:hypothetical protein
VTTEVREQLSVMLLHLSRPGKEKAPVDTGTYTK